MTTKSSQFLKEQYGDSSNLDIRIRLHEWYGTSSADWHEWVFDTIVFEKECRIVEFGCGSGSLWSKNRSKIKKEWSFTLTDLSEGMLDKARENIGEFPNFSYKVMDVQAADLKDSVYDIAIANHMLYHVPDINKALAEIKRLLKPNGTFYASTNGSNHTKEIYDLVAEFDPSLPFGKPLNSQYFGIENGEPQLRTHFGQVRLARYESGLRVTNVSRLADYMFSIGTGLREALELRGSYISFMEFLESKKTEQGYIPISKDSGIFICSDGV